MSELTSYELVPAAKSRRRRPSVAEVAAATPRRRPTMMAWLAITSLAVSGLVVGGRTLVAARFPSLLTRWDHLWRQPIEQQITGYVVLGLFAAALIYPLRRRLHLAPRRTAAVRVLHAVLGTLALAAIVAHTDLRLGVNLNRLLSLAFLAFAALGSMGSFTGGARGGHGRWRRLASAAHRVLLWPALALIGLHVLAVYYF